MGAIMAQVDHWYREEDPDSLLQGSAITVTLDPILIRYTHTHADAHAHAHACTHAHTRSHMYMYTHTPAQGTKP